MIVRGLFQSVVFFKEIPGVFADFQTVYEGVKKIPKIPNVKFNTIMVSKANNIIENIL